MTGTKIPRPKAVKALIVLEVLFGAMGIISGILLMSDPSGALIGFQHAMAEKIPSQSFFLVGLFLFFIYGLYPLFLAHGAWTRGELFFSEISKAGGIHWSWQGGIALVAILIAWLFMENLLIGLDYPATYMTIAMGLAIFIALVMPSTRRYFSVSAGTGDER
ncbi:MAG: hypothetical protein SA339_05275 [Methanomassiliicoccus sp.]|nr:hypothetical protein [Methanomassiliicoccus sp.]